MVHILYELINILSLLNINSTNHIYFFNTFGMPGMPGIKIGSFFGKGNSIFTTILDAIGTIIYESMTNCSKILFLKNK